jgi:hypothetical protein
MAHRMIWFLPLGLASGWSGIPVIRHLLRQGGPRHRSEAWFVLALTWLPLAVWLVNQLIDCSR